MNSDIRTIDLNNLDINNLDLPKEKFNCYVICNHTEPNREFLLKLIQGEVKGINACGKWSGIWEVAADKICVEYENNGKKPKDWYVTTEESNLDSFIKFLAFAHCEYYDDEILSHDPILLFYDDENLKNFVLKRVEWLLDDAKTPDPHENDEDYDYDKDFILRERIELSVHTNRTKRLGLCDAQKMIFLARRNRQGGMAIVDEYSTQSLISAYKYAKEKKNFKVLYGINASTNHFDNVNFICKNVEGKKAINEYLTHLFTKKDKKLVYEGVNGIHFLTTERQKIIDDNHWQNKSNLLVAKNNLLIGLSFHSKTTEYALSKESWINEIHEDIADCDYIEVAPIGTYKLYYPDKTDDEIKAAIKLLIKIAKEEERLVVAVSSPYYAYDSQYLEFSILWEHEYKSKLPEDYDGHLYTTEEMKYAFDWLDDDELVEEIVVTNTHKIADMCEDFDYIDETHHAPYIENAYEELDAKATAKMMDIYGPDVDPLIKARLNDELRIIKENNYASIILLSARICEEARKQGYDNGTRGSIGATLVGWLLGITKCNPLPPHTICPNCHKVVWDATASSGYDIKDKKCSNCGSITYGEGQNIPYQTFFGKNGERLPDIDLNLAPEFREKIEEVIEKVAPDNYIYRAGTVMSMWHKDAVKLINDFAGEDDGVLDYDTKEEMVETFQNVATNQGLHPGGFFIIPNNIDINDFTPLIDRGEMICTFNEYHDLTNYFYKADFLNHTDPECFKFFKDNGLDFNEIDILDPKVMELFNPDNELEYDYLGIPEFGYGGNGIANEIIELVRPKKFSDLVKISTLMHGTNTWNNNGKELFKQGISLEELLGSRDDVFNTLIKYGIDRDMAYSIMEAVRKGKGIETDVGDYLLKCNLPSWFVKSCNTIKYMFPKAHAIEYVINELMLAWIKIYKPALFYASYFNFRTNTYELDTMCKSYEEIDDRIMELTADGKRESNLIDTLYIAGEMARRDFKLINKNAKDIDTNIIFEINPNNDKEIIVSSPTI